MNLLLDTHVWLWWLSEDRKLHRRFENAINSLESHVFVSAISVWEVQIKRQLGKLRIEDEFVSNSLEQGIEFLSFSIEHAREVAAIPPLHQDPFDRALIAQAKLNRLTMVSADVAIERYAGIVDLL